MLKHKVAEMIYSSVYYLLAIFASRRQEDQHLVNYGSQGNSLECVQNNLRLKFWEWEKFENEKIAKVYLFLPISFSKTGSRTTQFSFTNFEVYSTEIFHSFYSIVESTSTLSYQAP